MKNIRIFFVFLFILFSNYTNGQEISNPRHEFLIDIGGNYNYFYGDGFIDSLGPLYSIREISILDQDYAGYTFKTSPGLLLGFEYDLTLKKRYIIELGLLYNNRRYIYESDSVRLKLYKNVHAPENTDVCRYDISTNNIEAEINLGLLFKRFTFFAGTKIFRKSFSKNTLTYLNGKTTKPTRIDQSVYNDLFPGIKIAYSIPLKFFRPQVYINIERPISISKNEFNKSIFILYGIRIPIFKIV